MPYVIRRLSHVLLALSLLVGLIGEASAQTTPAAPRPARKGSKYKVTIDSAPQQAVIYLDDKSYGIVGYTPWSGKLTKGTYKLILELPGFKAVERQIEVTRKTRSFFVPLERQILPGVIDVQVAADTQVAGAQLLVDGKPVGTAPTAVDVPEGRHLVEIRKSGFLDYSQWIEVAQAQRVTLTPVLKPAVMKGSLLVDADVADAEVVIDGKVHPDPAPTLIDGLEEGAHIVEVRKTPAVPWKQTVYVKGGQRTKVMATLAATMQGPGGNIRVLSNQPDGEVFLDGTSKGKVPVDLNDVPAGPHIVEVKAQGFMTRDERVMVNAGSSTIVKLDLQPAIGPGGGPGTLKILSPIPEAKVFIDGAAVGTVPVTQSVTPGTHFVVVEKEGYPKYEQKIDVKPGQMVEITAELKSVGKIRFLSNIEGAEIVLDGEPVGRTPLLKEDVDVGDHIITMRREGFYDHEQPVKVEGGKLLIINGELRPIDRGLTPEEVRRMVRGLSSFGARVMPYGRFTVDLGAGYPYYMTGRATVGVLDRPDYGFDVNVGIRTLLTTWEFQGGARVRFAQRSPFSAAAFATVGGGGGFSGRNEFSLQAGIIGSLTLRHLVTVSGRLYADVWSDRLCAKAPSGTPTKGPNVCTNPTPAERDRAEELLDRTVDDATDLQKRDLGVRGMMSLVIEAAIQQHFNVFLIFEGAPFQSERAGHTDLFNPLLFEKDPVYNFTGGVTAKF